MAFMFQTGNMKFQAQTRAQQHQNMDLILKLLMSTRLKSPQCQPDTRSLTDLVTAILQRVGDEIDRNNLPHISLKHLTLVILSAATFGTQKMKMLVVAVTSMT